MVIRTTLVFASLLAATELLALEPVPEKLVVLTFDDSAKSHFTIVRPVLKKYGFGATFFITEGFDFKTNKTDYMSWEEIAQLHRDGFEIGNHTRDHLGITDKTVSRLSEQLEAISQQCKQHGITKPVSFAYPGNATTPAAFSILSDHGIKLARRGGGPEFPYDSGRGVAYEPGFDHPLLVPSAGDARPDWELEHFVQAVEQAKHGRIAVLQFHGAPDTAHSWVSTPSDRFDMYMRYLATNGYTVVALRDLLQYVDPSVTPQDPNGVIADRQAMIAAGKSRDNARLPSSDAELKSWLDIMITHRFAMSEMATATGLSAVQLSDAIERFGLDVSQGSPQNAEQLLVLPYPGGRHPRIGFRDGAIRPQRETKVSVFAPWIGGGYVVADTPEAIWQTTDAGRELLYLAHTHVPTKWSKEGVELESLEWACRDDGSLQVERVLPNGVAFGAKVMSRSDAVVMNLWIRNGTNETLRGLRVQNCVMLKDLAGFAQQTTDNKLLRDPYVACRNETGDRWVISAWEKCLRPWGNQHCPCMHSDPQFPDCAPGQTQRLTGWLSFYQGTDIEDELKRIDSLDWMTQPQD